MSILSYFLYLNAEYCIVLLISKTCAPFFMHLTSWSYQININFKTYIHVFIDDKLKEWSKTETAGRILDFFNDGNEENVAFLENIFKRRIAEIRLAEGNY